MPSDFRAALFRRGPPSRGCGSTRLTASKITSRAQSEPLQSGMSPRPGRRVDLAERLLSWPRTPTHPFGDIVAVDLVDHCFSRARGRDRVGHATGLVGSRGAAFSGCRRDKAAGGACSFRLRTHGPCGGPCGSPSYSRNVGGSRSPPARTVLRSSCLHDGACAYAWQFCRPRFCASHA